MDDYNWRMETARKQLMGNSANLAKAQDGQSKALGSASSPARRHRHGVSSNYCTSFLQNPFTNSYALVTFGLHRA
uniref:Uncharacterized protein n=1 Tax=Steinernema glaseri TaxID=37863 RepID=A0A1I8AXH1_9BILA